MIANKSVPCTSLSRLGLVLDTCSRYTLTLRLCSSRCTSAPPRHAVCLCCTWKSNTVHDSKPGNRLFRRALAYSARCARNFVDCAYRRTAGQQLCPCSRAVARASTPHNGCSHASRTRSSRCKVDRGTLAPHCGECAGHCFCLCVGTQLSNGRPRKVTQKKYTLIYLGKSIIDGVGGDGLALGAFRPTRDCIFYTLSAVPTRQAKCKVYQRNEGLTDEMKTLSIQARERTSL